MKLFNRVLVATGLFLSGSVFAHVGLSGSVPANGAMLNEAPTTLSLTFSAPVRLVKLSMQDGAQNIIPLALPSSTSSQAAFTLALPALKAANYTVSWMLMGDDGHKMKGDMSFMVHAEQATQSTVVKAPDEHDAHH